MTYFGQIEPQGAVFNPGADYKGASRFQAADTFTATQMGVCMADMLPSGDYIKLGIYADDTGSPGSLLGSSSTEIAGQCAGWQYLSLASGVPITSGNYYWLAAIVSDGTKLDCGTTSNEITSNSDTYSDGFADPFGSESTSQGPLSIFACDSTLPAAALLADAARGGNWVTDSSGNRYFIGTRYLAFSGLTITTIHKFIGDFGYGLGMAHSGLMFGQALQNAWSSAAIDGNDDIHVVGACATDTANRAVSHCIFNLSSGWGDWEAILLEYTQQAPAAISNAISIDGSNYPHVLFMDAVKQGGSTQDNVYYAERTGGSWGGLTQIGLRDTKTFFYRYPAITLRNSDYVEAFYHANEASPGTAHRTYTTSWNSRTRWSMGQRPAIPGVIATTGGTVYRYHVDNTSNIEENNADTTYDGKTIYHRAAAALVDDSNRYIFYCGTDDDIHLISNDGGGWIDEGVLQAGTYEHIIAEWAYNNENQSGQINYGYWADANSLAMWPASFPLGVGGEPLAPIIGQLKKRRFQPLIVR